MGPRIVLTGISVILLLLVAVPAGAISTSATGSQQVAALKRVGVSWVTYVSNGNAPKACGLQVDKSVGDVPCGELPTYFAALNCPESGPSGSSSWRSPEQLIAKATVTGDRGTIVFLAARKKAQRTAKARFTRAGGKWRIASIRSGGQPLSPAGLIFTEGQELRQKLWPAHC